MTGVLEWDLGNGSSPLSRLASSLRILTTARRDRRRVRDAPVLRAKPALVTETSTPPRRALVFLGVDPTEERGVLLMAAHSFSMGCATVFFETAASATFLARFAPSYLPWVYIAAAVVNTVTGVVSE